jgi:uncharacterized protein (DUF427 family)
MSDASTPNGTSQGSAAGRPPPHGATGSGGAHRIEIAANRHRVRVIHQGVTMADTMGALTLAETGLPEVFYFPRSDVNMARLERSSHTSHCPFKGDAAYFHLRTEDGRVENAVWCYENPLEAARQIKGYLAFYASRVDRIDQTS